MEDNHLKHSQNKQEKGNYIIHEDKVLGRGAFGIVYQGEKILNDNRTQKLAFKEIPLKFINDDEEESIKNEIEISNQLDNTNIVKKIDIYETNNKKFIVYELCNGGDLRKYMDYFKNFSEDLIQVIMIQIINGLSELSKKGVIHHDIKPENILIDIYPKKVKTNDLEDEIKKIKNTIYNKRENNIYE